MKKPVRAYVPDNAECDICHCALRSGETFNDATTIYGPWAWLCKACFDQVGRGVGLGVGQEYSSETTLKLRG